MTLRALARAYWAHLSLRRRRQLITLLILMVLTSFAEVLSLGAVLPFLGVLTQPDKIFAYPAIQPLLSWLRIDSPQALLLPITLVFVAAALLAGGMRLLLLYAQTRLSFAVGADFSGQIYRRTLYQPYAVHVSRNSSEVISGVTTKVMIVISFFLTPILTLLSSAVILLAILLALLAIDPLMSLAAFVGFGAIYGAVILFTRKRLATYSRIVADESIRVVKVLQEGLGGIRDVLLDGAQEAYCEQYRRADIPLRRAQANSAIIGGAPRFAAEAMGMAFIAILAYAMSREEGGLTDTIMLLGALALGAQRLLPVLQQGYLSIVQLRSSRDSLQDALELLDQPIDESIHVGGQELPFQHSIELRDLGFRYSPRGPQILRHLNLHIRKGSRVGFVGTTGSGKSSLLDILMGLLTPTEGAIWIDDVPLDPSTQRSWQRRISHVPQSIYLSDASIAENIAFGVPPAQIDHARVQHAAARAQIDHTIKALPEGYLTQVGERGVRLSGGQRQRIGIARALYRQAEVLILDEATSALDTETERAVMDGIDSLGGNLTVLIVAHRLSTLQRCDQIVDLHNGQIRAVGTYGKIIAFAPALPRRRTRSDDS